MPRKPTYQELLDRVRELEQCELERSISEKSLLKSEEKFRLLYENAPVAYQSLDIKGRIIEVNKVWLDLLEYRLEEVIGQNFSSFLHHEWVPHFEQNFPRFKAVGEVLGVEFEMVKKDGSVISVAFNGKIGKDDDGGFVRTHCILNDITQQKKAEAALIQSELKLRLMAENISDVFWISTCGVDSMLYISPGYESIWGRSSRSLYQDPRSYLDAIHPDDIDAYLKVLNTYHKNKTKYCHVYRIIPKSGPIKWIKERGYPVNQQIDGEHIMTGVCTDITTSRQSKEALDVERRKLKTYFENLPLLAYNISLDGKITDCNEVAVQRLGYNSKDDLLGQPLVSKVYAPTCKKKAQAHLKSWQSGKTIKNKELQIITRQGETIDVLLNVNTIYNAQKSPSHSLSTHLDISDWKHAERALEKSERKYRTMMESIVDPLYICSENFRIEYANPAMTKRLGGNPVGEICYEATHGSTRDCKWCGFHRVKSGKTVETTVTSPLDNRTYRVQNMPIYNEDGSISMLTILRDITEYLQAIAEKENAQLRLLQAQKMETIGNLAGGVAHDFNNILSSIIGFSELALEDAEKNTMLAENVEQVVAAGQRAKNLVNQILAYARQSNEELKPIRVDLIAKEVLMLIRSTIPTSIAVKPDITSRSSILGDPTQVHQIFMNLCTNAAQAMDRDGGVLRVAVKDLAIGKSIRVQGVDLKPGNYICITVNDTGKGIDQKDMDSIFEPYFSTKEVGEGTGMGLAVVHGIVESHGGEIYVDSSLGMGSTFSVYLPITRKKRPIDAGITNTVLTGNERILFVDDEASITQYSYRALKSLGYKVNTRTSSIEALSLFQKKSNDFDLVITDMTMPNMTGLQLARAMMKIEPETSIIICTGYSSILTEDGALSAGIKALAYKPLGKYDLARVVRNVLDDIR